MAQKKYKINMMLADRYVPNWGAAEALREIVANAIDADPDYKITFTGNRCEVFTRTEPTLTEAVLVGAGTKSEDGETIGQFGEGLKLAALVLTRGRHQLKIVTTEHALTFSRQTAKYLDRKTLHVIVDPNEKLHEGCLISFVAAGVDDIYRKNFLPKSTREVYGPISKENGAKGCRVYCRGVLVKRLDESSLYDWNLKSVKLNRDRNIPDMWSVKSGIARLIDDAACNGNEDLPRRLLRSPESLEAKSWQAIYPSKEAADVFARVFTNEFGDRAVLSSGHAGPHNALAQAQGHDVVALPKDLAELVQAGGVQRASDVLLKSDQLTQVPHEIAEQHRGEIDELSRLLDVIGCGPTSFHIFHDDGKHLGVYDKHGVWLNINLFAPGSRFERIRTMLHEMGHQKGGDDGSVEFEHSLDFIAAKLGEALLAGK